MKRLLDLQLSIPTIDELTSRKLMGGDGYVPENDLSNALPEFDNDDMIEINIEDDVIITGDYPGVPNAPETEYDIPDPNMEPIEQERPDSNEEPEFDDDRDDFQNKDQDNPNEYEGPDGNHQGNTNNQGNDSEHEQLTPIDILISKLSEKQQDFLKSYNPTIIIDTDMQEEGQYIKEENLIRLKNTDNAILILRNVIIDGKYYYPEHGNVIDKNTVFYLYVFPNKIENDSNIYLTITDVMNNEYYYKITCSFDGKKYYGINALEERISI